MAYGQSLVVTCNDFDLTSGLNPNCDLTFSDQSDILLRRK
jgi:hypothetical protein